jgi:5'-AMP-activated protein kinase regulatory gamma subunit
VLPPPARQDAERARQTLVRLGAYQSLDLTIGEALEQRSPDFPGIVICTAGDSLGTLLNLIKRRRVHRLVVVEGEVRPPPHPSTRPVG